ncbi:pickpocket protein 19 [Drosophila ficusphila]|uniref:pickpocket protein 19 n=1 Tax=Drosophila ficusphila TaxID=30025 RepID=UPI0007E6917C|nr:pickpocket protein 19 [Drosophila ficusphila]
MFSRPRGEVKRVLPFGARQKGRGVLASKILKSESNSAWTALLDCYISRSHIHGLYLLFLPTMRRRMRILWLLALACAFTVLLYVSYLLGERYQNKQFQTVVAHSHASIGKISFPVVIICNKNRLNWSRLPEIRRRYNITATQEELFDRILTAYDGLSFQEFHLFDKLQGESLDELNHLNFTQIVSDMSWRCDEILGDCLWQAVPRNCCQLFRPRRLPLGHCLAFNELERRRGTATGLNSGLLVRLRLREALHAPGNPASKGFLLTVLESSVWFGFPIEVLPHARTNVAVTAVYHYFDESTLSLPSRSRRCVMDYEQDSEHFQTLEGQKYMLENCQAECQQRYLFRYCNCSLDLFYPPSEYAACRLRDLPCLAAHNHLLQNFEQPGEQPYVHRAESGLICECLHNCKSLTLMTDTRKSVQQPWLQPNSSVAESMWLNVYFKKPSMLVYKTNFIYTWVDLVVSFGGICQLCLGCSIISLVEFVFFSLFKVPQLFWRRANAKQRKVLDECNSLTHKYIK